jgi:pimeloyl-ACP methyl ester carboxylesterase
MAGSSHLAGRRVIWTVILILGVAAYLGWIAFAYAIQDHLVFARWIANPRVTTTIPHGVTSHWLTRPDGETIEAWQVLPAHTDPNAKLPTVLFAHGNGELIDTVMPLASRLANQGFQVILPEYRGYGRTPGKPSQKVLIEDVGAWYDEVVTWPTTDADEMILMGRSIGGSVAAHVAADRSPAGVLLLITPARCDQFAWRYGVPPILAAHPFRTDKVIGRVTCPIFLLGHRQDEIVPPAHLELLASLAADATVVEIDGTHNMVATEADRITRDDAIEAFLSRITQK